MVFLIETAISRPSSSLIPCLPPPGRFILKFVKQYGEMWKEAHSAIESHRTEVKSRAYPAEHTYPIPKDELEEFEKIVEMSG